MLSYVSHRERLRGADLAVRAVWYELNMQAAHEPTTARAPDGRAVALARGQWLTNGDGLARLLGTTRKVVRRCLAELQRRGLVRLAASRCDGTLVTVAGYGAAPIDGPTVGPSQGPTAEGAEAAPDVASAASGPTVGPSQGPTFGPPLEEPEELGRAEEEPHTPRAHARARLVDDDPFPVTEADAACADAVRAGIEQRAGCRLVEGREFDRAAWADTFRELRRERGVTHDEILPVLAAAFRDLHWQRRIDGAATIRKHWVRIALDARLPKPGHGKPRLKVVRGGYGRDVGGHR